jgi:hypothetical protein
VVDLCETHNVSTNHTKGLKFFGKRKAFASYAWRSKQPIYAFERDVSDKEALQVEQKSSFFRSIKVYK